MEIDIGEVSSTVRAVDGSGLLSPQVLQTIVQAVLQAVLEQQRHGERGRAERRITGGVSRERDEEG